MAPAVMKAASVLVVLVVGAVVVILSRGERAERGAVVGDVCFEHGEPAVFDVPMSGTLESLRLTHVSGALTCGDGVTGRRWGCADKQISTWFYPVRNGRAEHAPLAPTPTMPGYELHGDSDTRAFSVIGVDAWADELTLRFAGCNGPSVTAGTTVELRQRDKGARGRICAVVTFVFDALDGDSDGITDCDDTCPDFACGRGRTCMCHTHGRRPNQLCTLDRNVPAHLNHGGYLGACRGRVHDEL